MSKRRVSIIAAVGGTLLILTVTWTNVLKPQSPGDENSPIPDRTGAEAGPTSPHRHRTSQTRPKTLPERLWALATSRAEEPPQSWEGKPKSELTDDERQQIGATPIGYYVSRQNPRWTVVHRSLVRAGQHDLAAEVEELQAALLLATRPYQRYDGSALIAKQADLLERIAPLNLRLDIPGLTLREMTEINDKFAQHQGAFQRSKDEAERYD
jgi:hypothetical protein